MDHELDTTHSQYIKITVTGLVTKPELIAVIAELMQHPQYLDKHSYWDLTKAEMGLTVGDLSEIIGVLKLYRPEQEEFADRSALLVSGKMNRAMVNIFVTMANVLPFKYKLFKNEESAEAFLCN